MVVSLSNQVPVVSDVALSIAESLLGRRVLGLSPGEVQTVARIVGCEPTP
jgi:hypothetical protein